jgi:hypothetical protein
MPLRESAHRTLVFPPLSITFGLHSVQWREADHNYAPSSWDLYWLGLGSVPGKSVRKSSILRKVAHSRYVWLVENLRHLIYCILFSCKACKAQEPIDRLIDGVKLRWHGKSRWRRPLQQEDKQALSRQKPRSVLNRVPRMSISPPKPPSVLT